MKFNLHELMQLIKSKKYLILGLFIILIVFLNARPIVEGLTNNIGEYDYLAPLPKDNKISDSTLRAAYKTMILAQPVCQDPSNNCNTDLSGNDYTSRMNQFSQMATEAEWAYYAKNGKFPYNSYVLSYLKAHPDVFTNPFFKTLDDYQKNYPVRNAYGQFMLPTESSENPKSFAYKVFFGIEDPSNPSTDSQMSKNYNDFVSVCKKAIGAK